MSDVWVTSYMVHPVLFLPVLITLGFWKTNCFQPIACCTVNVRGEGNMICHSATSNIFICIIYMLIFLSLTGV
jgi:hypothetical protein